MTDNQNRGFHNVLAVLMLIATGCQLWITLELRSKISGPNGIYTQFVTGRLSVDNRDFSSLTTYRLPGESAESFTMRHETTLQALRAVHDKMKGEDR